MKRILIVSFSNTSRDPRVLRQIGTLSKIYDVDVAGLESSNTMVKHYFQISKGAKVSNKFVNKTVKALLLIFRLYERFYFFEMGTPSEEVSSLNQNDYDLVIANDFNSLPFVSRFVKKNTRILLDAHEYYFDEMNSRIRSRIFRPYRTWVAKQYLPNVSSMTTVSPGIADLYKKEFNHLDVKLVRNIPSSVDTNFVSHIDHNIELIHHGIAVEGRGIKELIDLVRLLDKRFSLNLMLVETDASYLLNLKRHAQILGDRVRFISPVPTSEIVSKISLYDLGIYLISPLSINNRLALPNKFFESIHANLGIIIGPSPEMAEIVTAHSIGMVSSSFELAKIAHIMNNLDRMQIEKFRRNSFDASRILCWEEESKVLIALVSKLVGVKNDF